jgi:peroxiredoxin
LIEAFRAEQIQLVAVSVDPVDKAKETTEKLGLTYPVAYGVDAKEISAKTGAFYEPEKKFLHAAGFVIRPNRTVEVACYSTGPIGRLEAQHALNLVKYYKSQQAKK